MGTPTLATPLVARHHDLRRPKGTTVATGTHPLAGFGRRRVRSPGVGVLAALEAVGLILFHLIASPLIGRRRQRWGTVGTEAADTLVGDGLVPLPRWSYTLAVPVKAPPEEVWPWIAQIGQGRGGFYTYQTLENALGCGITNTTEILASHQDPRVGDDIYLHPTAPPLRIEVVRPPNALVLFGSPADDGDEKRWGRSTWQFVVTAAPDGGSRILTRGRYDYSSDWRSRLIFGGLPIRVITFVMSRRMMLEIKRLAERGAA
jgi:hypothetical protein